MVIRPLDDQFYSISSRWFENLGKGAVRLFMALLDGSTGNQPTVFSKEFYWQISPISELFSWNFVDPRFGELWEM